MSTALRSIFNLFSGRVFTCSMVWILFVYFSLFKNKVDAQVSTYYNFTQSNETYTPGVSTTSTTPADVFITAWDDVTTIYALPFNFTFNGILYPAGTGMIGIDSDAWLTFSNGTPIMTGNLGGGSWVSTSDHTGVYLNGNANNNGFAGFNCDLNEQTFATISGVRSNGSNVITAVSSVANIQIGTRLSGSGIPDGTVVTAFTANTITMSAAATNNNTNNNIVPRSSIYAFLRGTAPNRQFVVQWTQVKRYQGAAIDNINFQLILNEGNNNPTTQTLQVVYGTCTSTDAATLDVQVGLRGATAADFNARRSNTNWATTTAATANTDLVRFSNTINPASGLTFTWSPCTAAPSTPGLISGPNPACPTTTQTYSVTAVAGATIYTWNFTGTGATYSATTATPSNNFTFSAGATAGSLTVTAGNLCGTSGASSIPLTFSSITTATINYPLSSYCSSTPGNTAVTQTGPAGGNYSSTPAGLTLNASSGAITPSSSTAGIYTVTYLYTSGSCSLAATASVSIQAPHTVTVTANPVNVCVNSSSQLTATATSGSGNYSVSSIAYSNITPSGSPTVLFNTYADDANSAAIPMPFSFSFYGSAITQFFVNTNGNIQLQTGVTPGYGPQLIPDAITPNNIIALCWEDLVLDPSTHPGAYIEYFVNGSIGNRVLVIEYNKLRFILGSSAENVTGQIRLYESDNHIEVAVGTVNDDGNLYTKTLGIENSTGTLALAPAGRNNAVWNVSNEAWAFNMVTAPSYTYSWSPATYLNNSAIANPVSTPTAVSTTNYTVTILNTVNGCSATGNVSVVAANPLNGTYTVGAAGNYTTLTAAVNAYNSLCIVGPVTFSLIDNSYPGETFPIIVNSNIYQSSINTLTIKPAANKTPAITGSSDVAIIKLNGADYVTIDGSNTVGGTTRDLSFINTSTDDLTSTIVWLASVDAGNGATNNTIKNCIITGDSPTTTFVSVISSGVIVGDIAEAANNNNKYINNQFSKAQTAIAVVGPIGNETGTVISNNRIGSAIPANKMGWSGIEIYQQANAQVINDTIAGIESSLFGLVTSGISVYGTNNGSVISGNKITDIKQTNSSGWGANGIYLGTTSTAANILVYNNYIWDVAGYGFNGFNPEDNGYGLVIDDGGGYKIYYNTVVLNTNPTLSGNHRSAAVLVSDFVTTAASVDMRNNIFGNTQTTGGANSRYAILSTANNNVYSNLDFNDYYSTGSTNLSCKGTNATQTINIAALRTSLGSNLASINIVPVYVNTASDLHLQSVAGNSGMSNLATPISTFTADYDTQTRNGFMPDMGADEWVMPNYGSWVGKTSIDWLVPTNWEANYVPNSSTDVFITGGYTFMPTVVTTQAMRGLVLSAPVPANTPILTINGGTLQVFGTITRTGGSIDGANGTLEMDSSISAQTIPAGLFINNNLKNLIINNSSAGGVTIGGALDIYRSVTFTGTGSRLNTGNFLTFKSTAAETAWLGNVTGKTISGNATVERYIPNHSKAWQFLSIPTSGQTVKAAWQEGSATANGNPNNGFGTQITSDVAGAATQPTPGFDAFSAGGPSMKTYDTVTKKWVGIANTQIPIANSKGYMLFVRGNRTVTAYNQAATSTILRTTGKLYTTGGDAPAVINLSANTFESVGNPYASAIDLTQLSRGGGVQDVYYVWDPKLTASPSIYGYGAYQTFTRNGLTYDITPGAGSYATGSGKNIESGQAFFVRAFTAGSVTFTESAKISGSNLVTKPENVLIGKQLKTNLKVMIGGIPVLIDGNLLQYDAAFSNDIDMEDALKMDNAGENIGLLSNRKIFVVERRSGIQNNDTIFYNSNKLKVQQYQLEFIANGLEQPGLTAFLEDTYLHTASVVKLSDTTTVMFSVEDAPGSYAADRFRIVFKQLKPVPVTITNIEAKRNPDNSIGIKWKVENEINIQSYTVQRSANGNNFSGILNTTAVANNGGSRSYNDNDTDPLNGDNFYRIKATGMNGSIQYSGIVKISPVKTIPSIAVYPNPVENKSLQLQFINEPAGKYDISLINKLGQQVLNEAVILSGGNMVIVLKLDQGLASGTYQLIIMDAEGSKSSQTIVVQ